MSAGQSAFSAVADVAALEALEVRLSVLAAERGVTHVATLRAVLEMHAVYSQGGMGFSAVPHAALALGCSEHRAGRLLAEGLGLAELPGALEAVECGLLTVEQSGVLVAQLSPVPLEVRLGVWRRLQARLCEQGVLPPARLAELLRRWVIAADPDGAQERRRVAEAGRRVEYRRRDDGLWDLFALGFRGPDAQAVLSRVAARSQPVGIWDDRTADQRRFDALKDLLLGRESLPLESEHAQTGGCGCLPGSPVPCGAEVLVHLRWEAAVGVSDEPAELVGHGPIEPDLVQELLLAAPRLRAVWTDEHGVPVAVDDRVVVPRRGDPQAVRQALLSMAEQPPQARQPRAPDDHQTPPGDASRRPPGRESIDAPNGDAQREDSAVVAATVGHQPDSSGPYRPPRRVRRLIAARAPRCEWPGCGARAAVCDAEHDLAWPLGATCACNLGPCCRRHHRVKQTGWTKTRHRDGSLTWTASTGSRWLSHAQHHAPEPTARPLRPVPTPNEWDELDPQQLDELLWDLGLLPDDDSTSRPKKDQDVPASDRLGHRLIHGDTRWTLDLDDPYRWLDA